ncbi:unnamed protein product [Mytilus edulis]|uniref:Tyr recombinase domain-containing protein n=1 Tax=Mytilus edulis TaxID=6550 RepID=A0A8S3SHC0_MYTED|nr:unnamed protein product [Mytilus edulis]
MLSHSLSPEQTKTNVFYLRPLSKPKENIWYTAQPIGINTLAATVGKMCTEAGLGGFRSNHSLRATAATRLYECGVDEQIISEVTGHRSDAVREYKRTSETMRRDACGIIRENKNKTTPRKIHDRKSVNGLVIKADNKHFNKWALVKKDVCRVDNDLSWVIDNHYPSEAWFEPTPNSTREDDGVLMTHVFDGIKKESYLVLINATSMQTISKGILPTTMPFSFHGRFFQNDSI